MSIAFSRSKRHHGLRCHLRQRCLQHSTTAALVSNTLTYLPEKEKNSTLFEIVTDCAQQRPWLSPPLHFESARLLNQECIDSVDSVNLLTDMGWHRHLRLVNNDKSVCASSQKSSQYWEPRHCKIRTLWIQNQLDLNLQDPIWHECALPCFLDPIVKKKIWGLK